MMTPAQSISANTEHIAVQSRDTAIVAKGFNLPHEGSYKTKESRITIQLDDHVSIHAIVREPIGAAGKRPACLFLHGAGTGNSSEVYGDVASAMASAGIVTLVPDKRLDNYSALNRDYPQMAKDYGKSFDVLKHWPGVDSSKAGLYAESEGTWISSIITANRQDVAFSILTSAPVVSGRQQMSMAASTYFADSGASQSLINDVPKLTSMDFSVIGLNYANFDSTPYLNKLKQPVLVNYGTEDLSMPIEQGARTILDRTADAGNENVTVRYYPANHQMRTGSHLSEPGLPLESTYTRNLEDWINAVTLGATASDWVTPQIAGAQPVQRYSVPSSLSPGLISSLGSLLLLLACALGLCVLSGLCALAVALTSWLRPTSKSAGKNDLTLVHRGFAKGIIAPLGWLIGLSAFSLLATLWYVASSAIQALSLQRESHFFAGMWVLLRVSAIAVVLLWGWLSSTLILRIHAPHSAKRGQAESTSPETFSEAPSGSAAANNHHAGSDGIWVARGFGHISLLVLAMLSAVLVMVSLAFWGLYSW
jgi:dienelactone hydrolase